MPEPDTSQHHGANPCARGIDRNSKEGPGKRKPRWTKPPDPRRTSPTTRKTGERRTSKRPQRPARSASAAQRPYVPSRNSCAYFTTVEHRHKAKSKQNSLLANGRFMRSIRKPLSASAEAWTKFGLVACLGGVSRIRWLLRPIKAQVAISKQTEELPYVAILSMMLLLIYY